MIFKRLDANVRTQNWTAISIELLIVIIGVFIGIQAANWNQQRQERRETELLLSQLGVELNSFGTLLDSLDGYYAITEKFADRAAAGWRGDPSVSDNEFVISAYQASQINAVSNNATVWALIFGAEDFRYIEDPEIRRNLARIMTFDFALVNLASVSTKYREDVRRLIPASVQSAIRKQCGDVQVDGAFPYFRLPPSCDIDLPANEVQVAANALRARPDLQGELQWHRAAIANQLLNVGLLNTLTRDLTGRIKQL